ncbi:MAG: hypothetical protein R3274_10105 [Desulfobacterales bacterium]|nr:hypothetical protein [Desulfobacterales bacterium]
MMADTTFEHIEEALRKTVRQIDKSVQVAAVEQSKKKTFYRVILLRDGKSGSAELKKDAVRQYLERGAKGRELKRALGKAVSHLSIRYRR